MEELMKLNCPMFWAGVGAGRSPGLLGVPQLLGGSAQDRGLLRSSSARRQLLPYGRPVGVRH